MTAETVVPIRKGRKAIRETTDPAVLGYDAILDLLEELNCDPQPKDDDSATLRCPTEEHRDSNASAFIRRATEKEVRDGDLKYYINCSTCGTKASAGSRALSHDAYFRRVRSFLRARVEKEDPDPATYRAKGWDRKSKTIEYQYWDAELRPSGDVNQTRLVATKVRKQAVDDDGEPVAGMKTFYWKPSRPGILYRLDKVLEAVRDGHPVWVVEGEKDCETAHSLLTEEEREYGTFTTAPDNGVTVAMVKPLVGGDVRIIADNDDAGFRRADETRAALIKAGHTGEIPIYVCDGVPEKGDLTDHLHRKGNKGLSREPGGLALPEDEADEAEVDEEQEEENLKALRRLRATEYAKRVVQEEDFAQVRGERVKRTAMEFSAVPKVHSIIEDTLAAEVNLLHGPTSEGKSLLARDWALHIAAGVPWRGNAIPEAGNVLWVASEGLHDFPIRWESQPLWDDAAKYIYVMDSPVNLTNPHDVGWLLKEYASERPIFVVFDVIYGMGMADDNGVKDALPVLNAMKRISAEWGAATLAIGHPGNDPKSRRMRGTSSWGQLAYTDWHMRDGELFCTKSKVGNALAQGGEYLIEYPDLEWLMGGMTDADRKEAIRKDIAAKTESQRARAKRLAVDLGLGIERMRQLIREVEKQIADESRRAEE